jgi:oligoendopeptidase F
LFKQIGSIFMPNYLDLLRHTGVMTAEDLAQTYLSEDIRATRFWEGGLHIVANHVGDLESQVATSSFGQVSVG